MVLGLRNGQNRLILKNRVNGKYSILQRSPCSIICFAFCKGMVCSKVKPHAIVRLNAVIIPYVPSAVPISWHRGTDISSFRAGNTQSSCLCVLIERYQFTFENSNRTLFPCSTSIPLSCQHVKSFARPSVLLST